MIIPDNILQQLVMHCQANNIGMAQLGHEDTGITIIIMGPTTLSPDQVSIVSAHMLLTGVISGGFAEDNRRTAEEAAKPIPKEKIF